MTHRTLQTVLRKLADSGPPESDADLLRRFSTDREEAAFAALVQRHGRLVWAVCRHLTRSDAEADDAFQATFLVLVRNAEKVRDAGKLSAWLHGVAYKVCSKARQSAKRRTTREATTATRERNGSAVPDSAWDRALAAVHEEVAKLPDTLRVPFVLCCLEGKGQTEAAEQLGWKLGTLSGRLTRAKDAVLAKLDARGLTLGAVAAVGLAVPPSTVTAKAAALVQTGCAVPGSILQLSQGVIGMNVNQVKLLAAGLLVACGLGVSGSGWLKTADAQSTPTKESAEQRVKRLEDELSKAKKEAADKTAQPQNTVQKYAEDPNARITKALGEEPTASTKKWDYDLVQVSGMDQTKFWKFLQDREDRGWEYIGTTPMKDPDSLCWVFRRPKAEATKTDPSTSTLQKYYRALGETTKVKPVEVKPAGAAAKPETWEAKPTRLPKEDDPAALDAEIKRLQDKRRALNTKEHAGKTWVSIPSTGVASDDELLGKLLVSLATKKFGGGEAQVLVTGNDLKVYGTKEVTDWAQQIVKKLGEK